MVLKHLQKRLARRLQTLTHTLGEDCRRLSHVVTVSWPTAWLAGRAVQRDLEGLRRGDGGSGSRRLSLHGPGTEKLMEKMQDDRRQLQSPERQGTFLPGAFFGHLTSFRRGPTWTTQLISDTRNSQPQELSSNALPAGDHQEGAGQRQSENQVPSFPGPVDQQLAVDPGG